MASGNRLFGWHTVAAQRYVDVNNAIQAAGSSPTTFNISVDGGSAQGTFGTWALTPGGGGPELAMGIPITGGTFDIGQGQKTISPCTATIKVHANFLPQPPSAVALKLASGHAVRADEAVVVESLDPPQQHPVDNAGLIELLQQWFEDHLDEFDHTFAVVNLDAQYTDENVTWLKPSHRGYAVAEPLQSPTVNNCVFAVLCLVDDTTPPPDLTEQVSSDVIPQGAIAGFLVSPDKYLQHMALGNSSDPGIRSMFKGTPPADHFRVDGADLTNTQPLTFLPLTVGLSTVEPIVAPGGFVITVSGNEVTLGVTDMQFPYLPGMTVHMNYLSRATLAYDATNQVVAINVTYEKGDGHVETATWVKVTEILLGLTAMVTGFVGWAGGAVSTAGRAVATSETGVALPSVVANGSRVLTAETASTTGFVGGVTGRAATSAEFFARLWGAVKFAAIPGGVLGAMALATLYGNVKYNKMPHVSALADPALKDTVILPGLDNLIVHSVQIDDALQIGLVHA